MTNTLSHHVRVLQRTAALALGTSLFLTLPLLAEESASVSGLSEAMYAQNIVTMFQKTGAAQSTSAFDGTTIDRSPFDFAAYVSHTCYRATPNDIPRCQELFGPYANLRWTLETGRLATILGRTPYLSTAASFVPQPQANTPDMTPVQSAVIVPVVTTTSAPSPQEEGYQRRKERSAELWETCERRSASRSDAVRCYQRNVRLTTMRTEDVSENVH